MNFPPAARVWSIPELQVEICRYLTPLEFRQLAQLSRQDHFKFTPNAWEKVVGLGNLLAILHPKLAIQGLGRGRPEVEVLILPTKGKACSPGQLDTPDTADGA
jgi:hypothetical protein